MDEVDVVAGGCTAPPKLVALLRLRFLPPPDCEEEELEVPAEFLCCLPLAEALLLASTKRMAVVSEAVA